MVWKSISNLRPPFENALWEFAGSASRPLNSALNLKWFTTKSAFSVESHSNGSTVLIVYLHQVDTSMFSS